MTTRDEFLTVLDVYAMVTIENQEGEASHHDVTDARNAVEKSYDTLAAERDRLRAERDAIMRKYAIESDESVLECIDRNMTAAKLMVEKNDRLRERVVELEESEGVRSETPATGGEMTRQEDFEEAIREYVEAYCSLNQNDHFYARGTEAEVRALRQALLAFGLPERDTIGQLAYNVLRGRLHQPDRAALNEVHEASDAIADAILAYRRPSKP